MRHINPNLAAVTLALCACFSAEAAADPEGEAPPPAQDRDSTALGDAEVDLDASGQSAAPPGEEPGRSTQPTAPPTAGFELVPEEEPPALAGPGSAPGAEPEPATQRTTQPPVVLPPQRLLPLTAPSEVAPPRLTLSPGVEAVNAPRDSAATFGGASERDSSRQRERAYGIMLDLAVPDGIMASALIRPWRWLRMHAGGGSNTISGGVRAGVSLIPFGIGPSATLEAGHYFEGNANEFARDTLGVREDLGRVLDRFGYDFLNGHVGLELGHGRVAFFAHAGVSYLRAKVHETSSLFGPPVQSSAGTTTITVNQDPTLVAIMPSAKLGFIAYIL